MFVYGQLDKKKKKTAPIFLFRLIREVARQILDFICALCLFVVLLTAAVLRDVGQTYKVHQSQPAK